MLFRSGRASPAPQTALTPHRADTRKAPARKHASASPGAWLRVKLAAMPPALKALLAQLGGCLLAFGAARSGILPAGLWPLIAAQAIGAAGIAFALRSAPWLRWIHLGFTPLVAGALQLGIAPGWYLAAFVVFALVYWSSFRTQVPLFLSNPETAAAVAEQIGRASCRERV